MLESSNKKSNVDLGDHDEWTPADASYKNKSSKGKSAKE